MSEMNAEREQLRELRETRWRVDDQTVYYIASASYISGLTSENSQRISDMAMDLLDAKKAIPALLTALDSAEKREKLAMRGLESLTPSGSEFVGDVERCVEFVKQSNEAKMRAMRSWAARAQTAESALSAERERVIEEVAKAISDIRAKAPRVPVFEAYFDALRECELAIRALRSPEVAPKSVAPEERK